MTEYGARAITDDRFGDRLLVIDDEPAFGQIVRRVAWASGFEVVVTNDPAAFMRAARQWHPTVIMLDLKMPGTDVSSCSAASQPTTVRRMSF